MNKIFGIQLPPRFFTFVAAGIFIAASGLLIVGACGPTGDVPAEDTDNTVSTTSGDSETTQTVGSGDENGANSCELYEPVESSGGGGLNVSVPSECNPFYFEKGRPVDDEPKGSPPSLGVGPEPFLGQEVNVDID